MGVLMQNHPLCNPTQFERLQQRFAYVRERVPFYRRTFAEAGVSATDLKAYADLARFPMVKKTDVIADQQAAPPYGTLLGVTPTELRRIYVSGGPLYIVLSGGDLERCNAVISSQLALIGFGAGDVVDIASSFHWVQGGWAIEGATRTLGGTAIASGPGSSALRIQVMRDVGVTVLQAFTPYAETLGAEMRAQGIDPTRDLKVRLLFIGGELRTAEAKERLSELWGGAVIREGYGTAETGPVGMECFEIGEHMHLCEDFVVEVIDPETGQHVPPGDGGELVITEFAREAQPFVRYRTGDITEGIEFAPCKCGRTTPRLKRIVGRKSSMLRVRGLFVYPEQVQSLVRSHPEFGRCQLVVDRPGAQDVLTLRVEYLGASPPEHLLPVLQNEVKGAINVRCEVALVPQGALGDGPLAEDRRRL